MRTLFRFGHWVQLLGIGIVSAANGGAPLATDDFQLVIEPPGTPCVLSCILSQPAARPAYGLSIRYRWDAVPMGGEYPIFVHIRNAAGDLLLQDDHEPPVPTAGWSGRIEYERTLVIPVNAPPGDYDIVAGIWNPRSGSRLPVAPATGATALGPDSCRIGRLRIAPDAPVPPLGSPTLKLDGYRVTFDEDFNARDLSVSAWGPGTRWIAHTPYAGDFGDASFADPEPGFPFVIEHGVLRIEARKTNGKWRSGLLASVDSKGRGFSQKYGYFEMRARFPKGPGTWPAFWLLGVPKLTDRSATGIEIDVVEQYGVHPNALHTTVHLWYPDEKHRADGRAFVIGGMEEDFHRYGVMVQPDFTVFYFDGVELRRISTPEEAKVPLYMLIDLALGGGWPIDQTPSPSCLYVDYVRAYAK